MNHMHPELIAKALINEVFHSRRLVAALFIVVNTSILAAGLLWPKNYMASTSILIDEKNIIRPLMERMAVATEVTDRGRNARETIYGRKIMNRIVDSAAWQKQPPSEIEKEQIIESITKRTTVTLIGRNIIKIEYRDHDPVRAYQTTKLFADLFIEESIVAKASESRAAFDFIERQILDYQNRLVRTEKEMNDLRSANMDSRGGVGDPNARMNELQTRIERMTMELREAEIKGVSLEKQVSGEAEVSTVLTREGQYRTRLGELQARLDTLRLSYHDTHPDIVQVKQQIQDLKDAIVTERQASQTKPNQPRPAADESVINNPVYLQLRRDMSQNKATIETLRARIADSQRLLQQEINRGKLKHSGDTLMTELTRDYQINRDIYQDLLRRRENARVSMNMDRDQEGLTFRIQEPVTLPQSPKGLQFWHFVVGGFLLGILVPLGLLFARLQIDPRIRIGSSIAKMHNVAIAAVVPHLWTAGEINSARRELQLLALAIGTSLATSAVLSVLRATQVI